MNRILLILLSLSTFTSLAACSSNSQDEPTADRGSLERAGYKPAPPPNPGVREIDIPAPHSLRWPVFFQDSKHVIGNSMSQFQPYDGTYWHGGGDLRVKAGAEVRAPIKGHVEAGHYSYVINPDGSMDKYWKAWPERGSDTYFEVAVVADDGTRYEFHHVNRNTLPAEIVRLLQAKGEVQAGDVLGYAIRWSDGEYNHIHYNIVAPNGIRINPEYISTSLPDEVPPQIRAAYAVSSKGVATLFGSGEFRTAPSEFVINVSDQLGANIYQHPPQLARLIFDSGEETKWDFTKTLSTASGTSPRLYDFFKASLKIPNGDVIETSGGYGLGTSLVRLKVPAGAHGPFKIQLGDQSGNLTTLTGSID
jgi:hypothetical protein